TDETCSSWCFIPMGVCWSWVVLARRTGVRLARAAQWKDLWQSTLGALAAFEFFVWGTITLVNSETVNIQVLMATIIPGVVFLLGYAWGVLGYFRRPLTEQIRAR